MKKHEKKQVYFQAADCSIMSEQPGHILTCFEKHKLGLKPIMVDFKKIVARALKFLQNREHEQLFNYITEVLPTERIKSEFLVQQGHLLLKYALSYSGTINVLNWIHNNFSNSSILTALHTNDKQALQQFFVFQYGGELSDIDDPKYRDLRVEKFKFLLQVDPNIIEVFMGQNIGSSFITPKIQEDYCKAKQIMQVDNLQLNIS